MKKITLQGKVSFDDDDGFSQINLIQKDGFRINLLGRLKEIKQTFPENKIQVCLYKSRDYCSKEKMLEGFIASICGKEIEAECEDQGMMGSEWTGWMEENVTTLNIGGHSFFTELSEDEFIIIDFNITP